MNRPLLVRLTTDGSVPVAFTLDGRVCTGLTGDTVLTAVLAQSGCLRLTEFSGTPRAGFCLMGACQDCWVQTEGGQRFRACTTPLEPGMALVTGAGT